MSMAPETVLPDANLHDVLIRMNRQGYRHLPVVDDGKLVGIITDRDVRLAVNSPVVEEDAHLTRQEVLEGIKVYDCMTPDPQCATSDMPAAEAADLLSLNKFGAMPVVDDGKLVGMISTIDFLKHYAAQR
jgi:acetoin utilization protein AcuB